MKTPNCIKKDAIFIKSWSIVLGLLLSFSALGNGSLIDIVLVLDNSGSMHNNDPNHAVPQSIKSFIDKQTNDTKISIIIFDKMVYLALPFVDVKPENNDLFEKSLASIDYSGRYTDSPAAIERAIYELKNYARPESEKIVVFFTDGIVDTGKPSIDLEKTRWLKQELAADAVENNIKIFSIGFTENADFQLIQSLAQQTEADYFRALQPQALAEALSKVHNAIDTIKNKHVATPSERGTKKAIDTVASPDDKIESSDAVSEVSEPDNELPKSKPTISKDESKNDHLAAADEKNAYMIPSRIPEDIRSVTTIKPIEKNSKLPHIMFGIFSLIISILVYVFYFKSKWSSLSDEFYIAEAYLTDVHNHTNEKRFKLTEVATMVGRVETSNNESLEHIIIPESTIGRRHALFEYRDYSFWVEDQGSTNGTFVNDKQIHGQVRLKDGDRVRFHKFEFVFEVPELQEDGVTELSSTLLKNAVQNNARELPEPQFDIDMNQPDTMKTSPADSLTDFDILKRDDESLDAGSEDATILPEDVIDISAELSDNTDFTDKKS